MNSFGILQALVFEPKKAFAAIAERPRILFPLLALIIGSVGIALWYTHVVDLAWLTDQQLRNNGLTKLLTEAQIEERVKSAGQHPGRAALIAALAGSAGVLIFRLLEAVYYLLAGKMTGVQRGFKHWMSLACWSSLPSLLAVIPAAILLATATTTQIDQASLQPLSLNNLFFHRLPADPGYSLLANLNLLQLAGSFYAAMGIREWSGRSWVHGLTIAFLPMVLFYGGWALIVMGRS